MYNRPEENKKQERTERQRKQPKTDCFRKQRISNVIKRSVKYYSNKDNSENKITSIFDMNLLNVQGLSKIKMVAPVPSKDMLNPPPPPLSVLLPFS